ncbi:hypothetical protein [Psychrobacillus psychrodurans]|uniref:hypothetical protein n=1 Tax=Psychrobacillus psychrodurans TaxID=126157 RepID=UPI003D009569
MIGVKLSTDSNGAQLEEQIFTLEFNLAHKMNDLIDIKRIVQKFSLVNKRFYMADISKERCLMKLQMK